MSERDIKRLLNTEADALIRERKGAILKAQIKNTGTDAEPSFRHGFLSVLSAAAAGLLIVSLFVVCLIPVAKKAYEDAHGDVGAASGQTMTGEETPHAGTSADPDGSTDDKQQTENPETNSDNTAESAEIETSKTDLISAEEFAGYIIRERNGEELDTKEIEKVKEYIDNTYLGIDVEYSRATGDGIDELLKHRGVDGSVPEAHILLYTDLKRLGLREEYGYPKLDLQTVCDIVNESDSFEEVLEGLGRAEKFFSASWRNNRTGMAGYTYDIKNSGDKCYERIFIDMDRKCVIYERNITDRESRDYHNSFGFYLFNEDTGAGRTGSITVDEVLKGLEYCVNHRLPGDL